MIKILISQRVDIHHSGRERRDALDQSWLDFIQARFEAAVVVGALNNSENCERLLRAFEPDLIILSGGNDIAGAAGTSLVPEREALEASLIEYSKSFSVPVLAVCRGFQKLNEYLGGRVVPCSGHVAVQHTISAWVGNDSLQSMIVNSYHNYSIAREDMLGAGLKPLYSCDMDGSIECAVHESYPWLALMWHPERNNESHQDQSSFVVEFLQTRLKLRKRL